MLHSRYTNKIKEFHERGLRIVFDDYESILDQLLEKDHIFSIHHQNIQKDWNVYKTFNYISGSKLGEFLFKDNKVDWINAHNRTF